MAYSFNYEHKLYIAHLLFFFFEFRRFFIDGFLQVVETIFSLFQVLFNKVWDWAVGFRFTVVQNNTVINGMVLFVSLVKKQNNQTPKCINQGEDQRSNVTCSKLWRINSLPSQ